LGDSSLLIRVFVAPTFLAGLGVTLHFFKELIRGFGLKGCEISSGRFLLLSHPFRMLVSFDHPRGLRFAPTPGYLLSSPSGKTTKSVSIRRLRFGI
jgi:hypothetical protein